MSLTLVRNIEDMLVLKCNPNPSLLITSSPHANSINQSSFLVSTFDLSRNPWFLRTSEILSLLMVISHFLCLPVHSHPTHIHMRLCMMFQQTDVCSWHNLLFFVFLFKWSCYLQPSEPFAPLSLPEKVLYILWTLLHCSCNFFLVSSLARQPPWGALPTLLDYELPPVKSRLQSLQTDPVGDNQIFLELKQTSQGQSQPNLSNHRLAEP